MREQGLLKHREALDRLGQEAIGPRRHRRLIGPAVTAHAEQHWHPGRRMRKLGDQLGAGSVRQPHVGDHDRGAVDAQMPVRRGQAVGPAYPRAGADAQKSDRLRGKSAVFDHQNGEAKQRALGGRGRVQGVWGVVVAHGAISFGCVSSAQKCLTAG